MTDEFICWECKKEIKSKEKYMKHSSGVVLCIPCYNKYVKKGEIK